MSFFKAVFGGGSSSQSQSNQPTTTPMVYPPPQQPQQPQPITFIPPYPQPQQPIQQQQQPISFSFQPPSQPLSFGQSASASAASSSSSSSLSLFPSAAPPPPVSSWELLGDDALAASISPANPFRDSNPLTNSAQPSARTYFTMVLFENKIYVFGGFGDTKGRFNDLRAFDLLNSTWEQITYTGDVPKPLYLHSSVVYRDSMYVFGGSIGRDSNDFYCYNFRTKVWKLITPNQQNPFVPVARYGHAATVLNDHMFIVGGCKQNNVYFTDAYTYHFPTNIWKKISDIPMDIAYHSLVTYQDRVLLVNGYNGVQFNSHIYSYSLQDDDQPFLQPASKPTWNLVPVTAKPSSSLSSTHTRQPPPCCGAAVVVAQDQLFMFGGYHSGGHTADLYKLDLRTNEWCVVDVAGSARPLSRAYLQACITFDGYLVIFGGYESSRCVSDFRRIRVVQSDVNVYQMLKEVTPKVAAGYALKHFGKPSSSSGGFGEPAKLTLDEAQLELLFSNLRQHLQLDSSAADKSSASTNPFSFDAKPPPFQFGSSTSNNPFGSTASSSSSSFLSSSSAAFYPSPAFYPFDTSRLTDLQELGFTKQQCLDCLDQMYRKKLDTKNFSLVVEHLLNYTADKPAAASSTATTTPDGSLTSRTASMSVSSTVTTPPAIPPRANSISFPPSTSTTFSFATASTSPPTLAPSPSSLPPSSNNASLQEQVHRLTEENKEIKSCKVCFEATIDCVLQPCGHLVVCAKCADDMKKRGLECPSCRLKLTNYMKVYWS